VIINEKILRKIIRDNIILEKKMDSGSIIPGGESGNLDDKGSEDSLLTGEGWTPTGKSKGVIKDVTGLCSDQYEGIDPFAKEILSKWFEALNSKGYNILRTCGYRSPEDQAKIKSHGQSVAPPGKSPHNFGLAVDLNISWKDSSGKEYQLKMASPKENWLAVMNHAGWDNYKDKLDWGGEWKKYDPVHFDVYPSLPGNLSRRETADLLNKKAKKSKSGKKLYSDIKDVKVN
jgi:hypothetical protein